jgi:hypothetical protein
MEKPTPIKHWKEVHHSRRESSLSLNESINSNRSSLSSGYNRFHFQRPDDSGKKSAIFQFTARNKDNPFDVSVLTKHKHHHMTPRAPKMPSDDDIHFLEHALNRMPTLSNDKLPLPHLKSIAKEIKTLVESFRLVVETFSKQLKDMREDWDRIIRTVISKEVSFEQSAVLELRRKLHEKQKEIDKMSKDS